MTDYDGSIDETLIATCSRFGVDHKAIIKQRQAEYKAEDKAAKALVKKAKL